MSSRLRFTTAQQVFDAFPAAAREIAVRPGDEQPLAFARRLASNLNRFDALTYSALLLPRREAVWWGCQCLRALGARDGDAALESAEGWVREPDDAQRRSALALWSGGDPENPSTWLAMAAGNAGGSLAPEGAPAIPAASEATANGVKIAIVLAIAAAPLEGQQSWIRACVEAAIRFAEGGDAKVRPPSHASA